MFNSLDPDQKVKEYPIQSRLKIMYAEVFFKSVRKHLTRSFNYFSVSIFENSLDPDVGFQKDRPDLDPNCLSL